jgi:hypothetical protein
LSEQWLKLSHWLKYAETKNLEVNLNRANPFLQHCPLIWVPYELRVWPKHLMGELKEKTIKEYS